jgi:glycosyltransferase involved in cell wall biosynthesis
MRITRTELQPLEDRGPLRVMFVITSMPVGGAETLLVNLVRGLDRQRFVPEICCLKQQGPLGEVLASEMPVHSELLAGKHDVRVLSRLVRLLKKRRTDVVVTVGAGDKMFWGRLAARCAGTPVVCSALHSTGWPDGVGRMNRGLTRWTDHFIAVAQQHGRFLVEQEGFPADKVVVIPNGVDTEVFRPSFESRESARLELNVPPDAPLFGIVAALRPEKNHLMFVRAAALIRNVVPNAHFWIVGEGSERDKLTVAIRSAALDRHVHLLGSRDDIPRLLAAMDVFVLSSLNEANPVSILEAMSAGLPVVATQVGSIAETVKEGINGFLVESGDAEQMARRGVQLAVDLPRARCFGAVGRREVVESWSLGSMIRGYEALMEATYRRKASGGLHESEPGPRASGDETLPAETVQVEKA